MEDDNSEIQDHLVFVIGFEPNDNLEETMRLSNQLTDYVNNSEFKYYELEKTPKFYAGIESN